MWFKSGAKTKNNVESFGTLSKSYNPFEADKKMKVTK